MTVREFIQAILDNAWHLDDEVMFAWAPGEDAEQCEFDTDNELLWICPKESEAE